MKNGETLQTIDPGKTLHGENGQFEVRSPAGENFRVECRQNQSISSIRSVDHPNQNWTVTKIADLPQSQQEESGQYSGGSRARAAGSGS